MNDTLAIYEGAAGFRGMGTYDPGQFHFSPAQARQLLQLSQGGGRTSATYAAEKESAGMSMSTLGMVGAAIVLAGGAYYFWMKDR